MSTTPQEASEYYLPSRQQLRLPRRFPLPHGWGMAGLCLGFIGLALAPLPVLGVPISSCALGFAIVGFVLAMPGGGVLLRWSFMGMALAGSALAVNVAITFAVSGYVPGRNIEPPWQPPERRPYVSPPSINSPVPTLPPAAQAPANQRNAGNAGQ